MIADDVCALVNSEHLFGGELAFVDSARAHCETQRFGLHDGANVAAGAEQPAARVQTPRDGGETVSELRKILRHAGEDATKRTFRASVGWERRAGTACGMCDPGKEAA